MMGTNFRTALLPPTFVTFVGNVDSLAPLVSPSGWPLAICPKRPRASVLCSTPRRSDSAFAIPVPTRYSPFVSTITAILEPDVDGTLHLPLPADMRSSKVKVVATLEAAEDSHANPAAKLKELLASGRKSNGAGATARIAEVYQDRETWTAQ